MSVIKNFLRLRKQDDRIKIIVALVIAAIVLFAFIIKNVIALYNYVNSPAEYELIGNLTSELRLDEIENISNVKVTSLQSEGFAQIKYKTIETGINFVALSEQYVLQIYGIKVSGNMTTFYANELAFNQILKELQLSYYGVDTSKYKQEGLIVEYAMGNKTGSARIFMLKKGQGEVASKDVPYIFTVEDKLTLKSNANCLRVYVDKQDMEQLIVKEFEQLGFSVKNREQLIMFEAEIKQILLSIRYQIILFFISILWIFTLHRYRKI